MEVDLKGAVSNIKSFIYPEKPFSIKSEELLCEGSVSGSNDVVGDSAEVQV